MSDWKEFVEKEVAPIFGDLRSFNNIRELSLANIINTQKENELKALLLDRVIYRIEHIRDKAIEKGLFKE